MIGGVTQGAGGAALGNHLADTKGQNEETRPGSSRGLYTQGIKEQLAELTKVAGAARSRKPIAHFHADPPEDAAWGDKEFDGHWAQLEQEFGLERQPYSEVVHVKHGREHRQRAYSLLKEDGTCIRLSNAFQRNEKLSRLAEFDTGHAFTKGAHNHAVIAALEADGRHDVADAMRAAGLHEGLPARAALTPNERAQQERTATRKLDVAQAVAASWAASDSGQAFAAALAEHGLVLACGDKRGGVPVVVDGTGNTHTVLRMLNMAAKADGIPVTPAADVVARLGGMALPSVAEARLSVTALTPPSPPDDGPPSSDALPPTDGRQDAPGAGDVAHAHASMPASHGGDAPALAAAQAAPGASIEDSGPGPGEPSGPNAHPDEIARYANALHAHAERKASAWARWLAQQAIGPSIPLGGGKHAGHAESTHGRHGKAVGQAYGWIPAAQEGSATRHDASPATSPCPSASEDRDDHAGGGRGEAVRQDHPGDAQADGRGVEPAARPGDPQPSGGAEPDRGPDSGRAGDSGKPAAAGGHARTAVRRAAATRHLEDTLASMPAAMKALRRACAELSPAWRAGRDIHARIVQDRARIASILATHPHPDHADRDPKARAEAYALAISDRAIQRAAEVDAAQAQAVATVQGRSRTTRGLAFLGVPTAAQRQAERMVARAVALEAEAADTLPSWNDHRRARADGEAHAYAARQATVAWEARPEVARAMEQHRLNQAVQDAIQAGDTAIAEAMDAGDPERARAIIRVQEKDEEFREAERAISLRHCAEELPEQLHRETSGHDGGRPPSPGRR